jgi:hypothetical protein
MRTPQARWSYCSSEKLDLARGMIKAKWPELTNHLTATGLRSDPQLTLKLLGRYSSRYLVISS